MLEILKGMKLNKFFNEGEEFHVLKDVSLSISKGEFVSIIGKSGSGKSTLLYLLSTLDTDYKGEIEFNGKVITGLTQNELAALRNQYIGFVFQFHFLLPEFSVLENVMLPALKLGKYPKKEIEERAMSILAKMDMHGFAKKLSGKLSGGQQQRVAIARALINDPLIIMADEPTGNLDTHNTEIVFEIFRNVVSELGNTIIAVTHDPDFAARSDRTIELVDGRVV
jgi:lipoprotein-releasing system ATP-binding protein